jgi:phospholipid-translocating ATPase
MRRVYAAPEGGRPGTNAIRNTKYTVFTFIPLNLKEQFGRFMNLYFLFIACLQLLPSITPVAPASTWVPLAFIFFISALKEGIDDFRRAQSDRAANTKSVRVLRGRRDSRLGYENTVTDFVGSAASGATDFDEDDFDDSQHDADDLLDVVEIAESQAIAVGDIVLVRDDEEIPCDMVLLASSDRATSGCYIETANIDGETDYKPRAAVQATRALSHRGLADLHALIECGDPNAQVYDFDARLLALSPEEQFSPVDGHGDGNVVEAANRVARAADPLRWESLSSDQMLLQGTFLRNTEWVVGCAVYTGNESKLGCSKKPAPLKLTKADRLIDRVTIGVFLVQFILVLIFGVVGNIWQNDFAPPMWYLDYENGPSILSGLPLTGLALFVIPLRFLLLNSMMIPISLKVSMDVVKFSYAKFIDWDVEMALPKEQDRVRPSSGTDSAVLPEAVDYEYARAVSTAISEDLGQVEYVLTDKTGTLTDNIMEFVACSVNGRIYWKPHFKDHDDELSTRNLRQQLDSGGLAEQFVYSLALNHTVVASGDSDRPTYKAASPDEHALVEAARRLFGLQFVSQDAESVVASWLPGELSSHDAVDARFERVAVMEFSSDRKRMSVVLRDVESQAVILFTKGADEVVLPLLRGGQTAADDIMSASKHLEEFALQGLRTLCVASRTLSAGELERWLPAYEVAKSSLTDRDTAVTAAFEQIEERLTLLGITAIEDKLQGEDRKGCVCCSFVLWVFIV